MLFIHNPRVPKNFLFDKDRKYEAQIASDDEDTDNPADFKPSGLWLSPLKASDKSYTFHDHFVDSTINNVKFMVDDNTFVKWTDLYDKIPIVGHNKKILVIEPLDIRKLNSSYRIKSSCGFRIKFSWVRENFGGVLFKPYDYNLRSKYLWYSNLDGECMSVWNLDLVKLIDEN